MDAHTILRIKPELTRFLHQFDDCFGRVSTRRYLDLYVEGQLSDLERKSIEPMADASGEPPRNLQQFLSLFRWDEQRLRDRLQQHVGRHHLDPDSVGVIDETSFVKKGDKTTCVHLAYATADFHTLLDGDLFLPEPTWMRTGSAVKREAFRTRWCIVPNGRSPWSNINGRWPTACGLPGSPSMRIMVETACFGWFGAELRRRGAGRFDGLDATAGPVVQGECP